LQSNGTIKTEKERWIYLFKEGKDVDMDNPPESLSTKEMRQVMKVLHRFSENEKDYLLYQSRMDAVLKENTYFSALEEAQAEKEQALKEKEQALKEKEQVAKEKEQAVKEQQQAQKRINDLLLLLEKKGIEPDKELM
jgi:vacuolar-type H+-ATPase subunit I/STV1